MLKILFAVLTMEEIMGYVHELAVQHECDNLLSKIDGYEEITRSLVVARKLSWLRQKEIEWDAIARINGIIRLCNGVPDDESV